MIDIVAKRVVIKGTENSFSSKYSLLKVVKKIATWKNMTSNSNVNLLLPDADIAKSIVSTRGKNKNTLYQITDSQHI